MLRRIAALLCLAAVVALAGCNTMEGLGKDLKALGGKIEDKAEEKK
jgi:predicted small secreted protein